MLYEGTNKITFTTLEEKGYIETEDIKDPRGGNITGCISYEWLNEQFVYTYDENCS